MRAEIVMGGGGSGEVYCREERTPLHILFFNSF